MAGRKEYEMLFQLNAQLGGSYSKTFKAAQQEIVSMQKEIQALSKTQADISAFQKQQAAVEATRKRLEMLRQQYDNIQREMEETGNESADMKNKLLAKQLQIDKTSASLEKQTAKLNELSGALEEAGVNTDDLSHSSEQLAGKIDTLKKKQGEAADKAMTFGDKAGQAFDQVHEAIVAAGIAVALKEIYEYFASCAQASMDFESAMTGVAKTTDLTDEELADMSDAIKAMSTEIPATTTDIAAVAEAAGQLGIQKDALLDFTSLPSCASSANSISYSFRDAISPPHFHLRFRFSISSAIIALEDFTHCARSPSWRDSQKSTGVLFVRAMTRHCLRSHAPPSPTITPCAIKNLLRCSAGG